MIRMMKILLAAVTALSPLHPTDTSLAQAVPTMPPAVDPKNRSPRVGPGGLDIGPGNIGGGLVQPPPRDQTTVRTISYIALSPDREWTSTDGKVITAKVIAWQDSMEETVTEGKPTAEQNNPSANPDAIPPDFVPVVLQDNHVRILRGKQAFGLPLDRLSEEDQAFVRQLDEAVRATAARRQAAEKAAQEEGE